MDALEARTHLALRSEAQIAEAHELMVEENDPFNQENKALVAALEEAQSQERSTRSEIQEQEVQDRLEALEARAHLALRSETQIA
jgi:regulator of replication initiation timing